MRSRHLAAVMRISKLSYGILIYELLSELPLFLTFNRKLMTLQKGESHTHQEYSTENHAESFKLRSNINVLIDKELKNEKVSSTHSSQKRKIVMRVESRILSDLVEITDSK